MIWNLIDLSGCILAIWCLVLCWRLHKRVEKLED